MLVTPSDVVRALGRAARGVDDVLTRSAARNAALGLATWHARRLDDARTLRDLGRLEARASRPDAAPGTPPAATAR